MSDQKDILLGLRSAWQPARLLLEAAAEIERLQAENFALAADQCHAGYGAENGDHRCNYQDVINELREQIRIATLAATVESLSRDGYQNALAQVRAALEPKP